MEAKVTNNCSKIAYENRLILNVSHAPHLIFLQGHKGETFSSASVLKSELLLPELPSVPTSLSVVEAVGDNFPLGTIRPQNGRKLFFQIGVLGFEKLSSKDYATIGKGYRKLRRKSLAKVVETQIGIEVKTTMTDRSFATHIGNDTSIINCHTNLKSTGTSSIPDPPLLNKKMPDYDTLRFPFESPKKSLKYCDEFVDPPVHEESSVLQFPTTPSKTYQKFFEDGDIYKTPTERNSRSLASHAMFCLSCTPRSNSSNLKLEQDNFQLMSPLDSNLSFLAYAATIPDISDDMSDLLLKSLLSPLHSKGMMPELL